MNDREFVIRMLSSTEIIVYVHEMSMNYVLNFLFYPLLFTLHFLSEVAFVSFFKG